jgi:hypothetical protein
MHRYSLPALSAALAAGLQLASSNAFAHIELQEPLNRYSDIKSGDNKSCPCGSGTTNRSCRKPEELSDPNRSADRATTFAPGDTITVRFDEYVGHAGRYRIAFDPDGADLDDFNENILLDEPDPRGNVGNMGDGSMWEFQVTLPDVTCDNCTLQLIQVMDGNITDAVLNPVDRGGTYFQCADIVLADGAPAGGLPPSAPTEHLGQKGRPLSAATPTMATSDSPSAMPTGMMTASSGMMAGGMAASGTTPTASAATSDAEVDAASDDDGGCSISRARSSRDGAGALALAGMLVGAALHGRRRRAHPPRR